MIEGDIFDNIYLYHIYRYTDTHASNTYMFQITYGQKSSMKLKNSIHYAAEANLSKNKNASESFSLWKDFLKCTRKILCNSYFFARPTPLRG